MVVEHYRISLHSGSILFIRTHKNKRKAMLFKTIKKEGRRRGETLEGSSSLDSSCGHVKFMLSLHHTQTHIIPTQINNKSRKMKLKNKTGDLKTEK